MRRRKPKRFNQMTLAELDRTITLITAEADALRTLFREAAAASPDTLVPAELRRKANRLDYLATAGTVIAIELEMRGMGATRATVAKLHAMEDRLPAIYDACNDARDGAWQLLPVGGVPEGWIRARDTRIQREAAARNGG